MTRQKAVTEMKVYACPLVTFQRPDTKTVARFKALQGTSNVAYAVRNYSRVIDPSRQSAQLPLSLRPHEALRAGAAGFSPVGFGGWWSSKVGCGTCFTGHCCYATDLFINARMVSRVLPVFGHHSPILYSHLFPVEHFQQTSVETAGGTLRCEPTVLQCTAPHTVALHR